MKTCQPKMQMSDIATHLDGHFVQRMFPPAIIPFVSLNPSQI